MSLFQGPRQSGKAPYGYCYDNARLVRYTPEQNVIKQIIQLHELNTGAAVIARILNESGIGARHNGAWTYNQVRNVLTRYYRDND